MSEYAVVTLRDLSELKAYRSFWKENCRHINADIDYFETIVRSRPCIIRPNVICVSQGGLPVSLLVARLEQTSLRTRLGYFTIFNPKMNCIAISYGGLLGDFNPEICRVIWKELKAGLRSGDADIVKASHLRLDSPLRDVILKDSSSLLRETTPDAVVHFALELPNSIDDIIRMRSTKKARANLRRIEKHLDRDFKEGVVIERHLDHHDLSHLLVQIDQIAGRSYQRRLGAGFKKNKEWANMFQLGFDHGWLRVYIMRLNDNPVAYAFGYLYKGTFYYEIPGYTEEFKSYSVGTYLMLKVFEDLIEDDDAVRFDYGFGDAQYKRGFSTHHWFEENITVYRSNVRCLLINLTRKCSSAATRFAYRLVKRYDLHLKIKARWRTMLRN